MIIDSQKYNGICACGREHYMQTELCVISAGCLREADKYLQKHGLCGYTVAVYDRNTYEATADRHPRVDKEVILDPTDLHANEHGVAYLSENLPTEAELLIAVGSGTLHDLTRYCAYERGLQFVSCPTAASVDGFCSSVAAMTWKGCKKTLTAVAPRIVLADIDVIKRAPMRLTRSGFGDMIGKYVALTDWRIANLLSGEFYCERIADMTLAATEAVLHSMQGIYDGEDEAYEKLTYGLIMSGLAMQMMGNSRPASGAEHHISHLIEMSPPTMGIRSDALHGEKVGVGTLMAIGEYKRLADLASPRFADYKPRSPEETASVFGQGMAAEIIRENLDDSARGVTADRLCNSWESIRAELGKLPDPTALRGVYESFGVKSRLLDIGVSEERTEELLRHSPQVRNRLTLMRLRNCIN
ncbi:MAG: sn-glycerol-1-phosphate dehydrogenase [Clostridia bacterium]|nr:sn-glycerol-1-phosphate dehydrogenase [Clostridia bacterium]